MKLLVLASWLVLLTVFLVGDVHSRSYTKREIQRDSLDPTKIEVDIPDVEDRDKRAYSHQHAHVAVDLPKVDYKAQGFEQSFGLKNALLGFVFNKINSFIDKKTAWVDQLDKSNIPKNKAAGIEPPKDPKTSLAGAISGVIGTKLEAAGPIISFVTSKIASSSSALSKGHPSGDGGYHGGAAAGKGFDIGGLLGGALGAFSGSGGASSHPHPPSDTYGVY